MIARITPRRLQGEIAAIPSKSEAHRLLICAALADKPTRVVPGGISQDIDATMRCLNALGADIRRVDGGILVNPISFDHLPASCTADCGESGSTLRFILPLAGALGVQTDFVMHGRLPDRPISPLDRELTRGGCKLSRPEHDILRISGKLRPGAYELPGNVSSQYITGMLYALSILDGESSLAITGELESAGYIDITLQAMAGFSVHPEKTESGYRVSPQKYISSGEAAVGGDWSNAALWLCADGVQVSGLNPASAQGDRQVAGELAAMRESNVHTVDASGIPDLMPALAAYAAVHDVQLHVTHAERLRIKESDRIAAIARTLNALGAHVEEFPDGLIVHRGHPLRGGCVSSAGDHRIAMMAAIASTGCTEQVEIRGAEAVSKSDPAFWQGFMALGGQAELIPED
ncbi:MAG: 3-phosphoshikimate 1-carboxyvinyltransferase [Clostridia bacterium]|nr:3-phosphoshikimate 1-carboxyvinyltransferase [Clostridia bacterium]